MKWIVKGHKRVLSHLTLTSVFIIVLNLVASSGNAKVSTPLLEYLKMKRSSRVRPISAVSSDWKSKVWNYLHSLSPPQRLPLGIPIKIVIIEKIESAPGTMGRGKRQEPEASLFSFPFSSCPAHSLFLSPHPPHNTKRPL